MEELAGPASHTRSMYQTWQKRKRKQKRSERGESREECVRRRGTAGRISKTLRAWKGGRELEGGLRGRGIGSHSRRAVMGWGGRST